MLVGRSATMREVERAVDQVAGTKQSVLILGETGTGKERVAAEIHARSRRAGKAWQPVNCAALSPEVADSELHGHARGAFTGATSARPGLIKSTDGGTLFLDEVGTLPFAVQAKLLRTLEDPYIRPVGGDSDVKVNVRFIAATSASIEDQIAKGLSKRDFFARFGCTIEVPALRTRPDDIEELAMHFLATCRGEEGLNTCAERFSGQALGRLRAYPWPGNVRELRHVVERALSLSVAERASELDVRHIELPAVMSTAPSASGAVAALAAVAESILDELRAGTIPPQTIEALFKSRPDLSLKTKLAEAFMARYKGQGLAAKAKELFTYSDLEAVRRFLI